MSKVIPLLFLTLMMLSCDKGTASFTIKGTILDFTFTQPLAGADVRLFQLTIGGSSYKQIASTQTESDGSYSFTFDRDKVESYLIRYTKDNYFLKEDKFSLSELSIKKTNYRNYFITAKSWVNLRFVHTAGNASDVLKYIKQEGKEQCDECCPITYQYVNGLVDTSIYCINDGNTPYSYNYFLLNTTEQGNRSITTIPFDTVELILNY